jgi:hypothetical protein
MGILLISGTLEKRFSITSVYVSYCNDYVCKISPDLDITITVIFKWVYGDANLLSHSSLLIVNANERNNIIQPKSCYELMCAQYLGNSSYKIIFTVNLSSSSPRVCSLLFCQNTCFI